MKTRRVLYVDDDACIGRLVKRFFEQHFPTYEMLVTGRAEDAISMLRARDGTPEFPVAVITDVRLGNGADGSDLVRAIRELYPALRTIAVSAVRSPRDLERVQRAGVSAFLEKELNLTVFVTRLFDLLQCPTDTLPERNNLPQPRPLQ